MIADDQKKAQSSSRRLIPWLNLLLVVILLAVGIWYLADKVSLAAILDALRLARPLPIILGVSIMLATVLIKAWRWQLMFIDSSPRPTFLEAFWALMLGQYVNLVVPFLRMGEVARIYALKRQTNLPMAQSIGTLVVEKVLDLFMLGLTIAFVVPFIDLPEFLGDPGPALWAIPVITLLALYVVAFQTSKVTAILQRFAGMLPKNWIQRPFQWAISGLDGLAVLRSGRTSLVLVLLSALIAVLAVLLPYVLFAAFDFQLTVAQAALINVALIIITTPPSTPGKIGVFNGVVAIVLYSFGITDDAAIIGYSIVFYLVVIVPQLILGTVAAVKTDWHWQKTKEQTALS